jgi:type I restriction enzyme R subunit
MKHRAQYLLNKRGMDRQKISTQAGEPDAHSFDLLCDLAFHAPVLTRRRRADRVKKQQAAMFNYLRPEGREILDRMLEKYASNVEFQFTLPDVLKVPPISQRGNVNEIIGKFCGADQLRAAIHRDRADEGRLLSRCCSTAI